MLYCSSLLRTRLGTLDIITADYSRRAEKRQWFVREREARLVNRGVLAVRAGYFAKQRIRRLYFAKNSRMSPEKYND
jgi:hypothetical protein